MHHDEPRTKTVLYSWWKCSVGLSFVEITGNKRVRRDFGLESKLSDRRAVRRFFQVSLLARNRPQQQQQLTQPDHNSSEMNDSSRDLVRL
jgi:hypothetical protein